MDVYITPEMMCLVAVVSVNAGQANAYKDYVRNRRVSKRSIGLNQFRYVKEKDRVICPAQQLSIGRSPHEHGWLYFKIPH